MKKILLALCTLVLLLCLAACKGGGDNPEASPSPAASPSAVPTASPKPKASPTPKGKASPRPKASPSAKPAEEPEEEEEPESSDEPEPTPEPEPVESSEQPTEDPGAGWIQPSGNDPESEPTDDPDSSLSSADPNDFVNSDVNALYGVFGVPNSAEYGPSCIGPGEDGKLYYNGFTVYTYREEGVETVKGIGS